MKSLIVILWSLLILVYCVGCASFLPAISFSCRTGEFGPAATLEAAKINEELIYNLSTLCAVESDSGDAS